MARISPQARRAAIALGTQLLRRAVRAAKARRSTSTTTPTPRPTTGTKKRIPAPSAPGRGAMRGALPTAKAKLEVQYAPSRDGDADPGEIVWTWVPYEEDPSQGKDRPVLVIGRHGEDVAALQLTSRPRNDRHHHPLGAWGEDGRPSWVKLDRVLRLDPDGIRREGAVLDETRFRSAVSSWESY